MVNKVEVRLGKTINTGNYNSVRVDVGFSAEYDPKKGSAEEVFEEVREKVHEFLRIEEENALKGEI